MSTADAPCDLLPWDSAFFGFPVARVRDDRLTPAARERIDGWCIEHGIRCLYFQARADDRETHVIAERSGYSLVDVRMTFERKGEARDSIPDANASIRPVRPEDVRTLEAIASTSHRDTRFYVDRRFPREKCDELYARWIRSSYEDSSGAVYVAEAKGRVAGYVTCGRDPEDSGTGRIGLIAVATFARGKGVGTALVRQALRWMTQAGQMQRAIVVTQGRNLAAQRLYQRCGFVTRDVHLYYHKWYS